MGVGVPGFGIASIFYVFAALFAPFREVLLTIRGRSSAQRWRMVGTQAMLASLIVASVFALFLAADALIARGWLPPPQGPALFRWAPNYLYSIAALALVLFAVDVVARWVRVRTDDEPADEIAAAHARGAPFVVLDLRANDLSLDLRAGDRPPQVAGSRPPAPCELGWAELAWALAEAHPVDRETTAA